MSRRADVKEEKKVFLGLPLPPLLPRGEVIMIMIIVLNCIYKISSVNLLYRSCGPRREKHGIFGVDIQFDSNAAVEPLTILFLKYWTIILRASEGDLQLEVMTPVHFYPLEGGSIKLTAALIWFSKVESKVPKKRICFHLSISFSSLAFLSL